MHYDLYSASRNPFGTNTPIFRNKNDPGNTEFGNEIGMTRTDIEEVKAVYG